ncbi:chemotaxis-specific protein-glutamate methyltransferase CheB [Limnobacter sp.]|uniref:chemotaxis-specific protein-glutamate methyltransferase CheB n=1 Tax=Limnobacter sp. TaxID=2003368 RepID=UPI003518E71D
MIKLLIVDDSALMRRQLAKLFESEGDFQISLARNGAEAVRENLEFEPDVLTLDINMPEMDGLTALAEIMASRPVPVVMVSSLTERGALATFEALALGAVDYLAKPDGTISLSLQEIGGELIRKVRQAARSKIKRAPSGARKFERPAPAPKTASGRTPRQAVGDGLVLVGVSTGGPRTLEDILPKLPADYPWPILVAQHMPATFTLPFANRMNDMCELRVVEASKPMMLEPGTVYIGKGGADMVVTSRSGQLGVMARPENNQFLWHPSVELLGRSALEHCPANKIIGVMLTGMGHDGADAFANIKKQGGRTIAESQESAVVFGMPCELIERAGATVVITADKVAAQLIAWSERPL